MDQMLLLISVLIALFLMSTKQGQKVVKDVSKSVSSITSQKGKGGFPSGLVLVLVLFALLCLSRKKLVEGLDNIRANMTLHDLCEHINSPPTGSYSPPSGPSAPPSGPHPLQLYYQSQNFQWGACPASPKPSESFCNAAVGSSEHREGWERWKSRYMRMMNRAWPTENGCPTYPPPSRGKDVLRACWP